MVKGRFTPTKLDIVLEFLNTNISTAELCRKHNLSPQTFYQWKNRFVEGGKESLKGTSNNDVCRNLQKENETLKRIVGEMTIVNDTFKKTLEGRKR